MASILLDKEKEEKLGNFLIKYRSDRPKPKRKYDQFLATEQTTARRALFLEELGFIESRIALLGDDDLTSLALSLLGGKKVGITVFEIDEDLVRTLKRIAQKESLAVQVFEHDVLEGFARNLENQFDAIFTDPPYTPSGISIFLNGALQLIKKVPESRIFMCYGTGEKARERELVIQEIITQKGLLIEEKIRDFNHYVGAGTIDDKSSLYVLSLTPKARATTVAKTRIYTNQ